MEEQSATCGDCLAGFIEDGGDCVRIQDCGSGCPEGEGCYPVTGECFTCDFDPSCTDSVGETGQVLIRSASDGSECLCETKPGYYRDASGEDAVLCDADGDGWVTQAAQASVEGDDVVVSINSRCTVLKVSGIVLENEAGAETRERLSTPLPLYESVRNDGGTAEAHPSYGDAPLGPTVLNSLTKACVSTTADYNDNGAEDVSEWKGSTIGAGLSWNAALRGYFAEYARFAYYVELHDGWYEDGGSYRIVERQRTRRFGEGVPLEYPDGAGESWQECQRHIDVDYGDDEAVRSGGDFSEFGEDWGGMTHTSQFKCVQVVDENGYQGSLEENPEVVFISGSSLARRTADGDAVTYDWTPNTCVATEELTPGPRDLDFAQFNCETLNVSEVEPGVYWAAVGFQQYDAAEDYERGCVDQCAEEIGDAAECHECTRGSFGEGEIVQLPLGTTCDGGVCDGFGRCGTCVPGSFRCKPSSTVQQLCSVDQTWVDHFACGHCEAGLCYPECAPTARRCVGDVPQECDGTGHWQGETCPRGWLCSGAGVCQRKEDGQPCTTSDECVSGACRTYLRDVDGDGFGSAIYEPREFCGTTAPPGYATVFGDCCDLDANARPSQAGYFISAVVGCGGYDYNCDGTIENRYPTAQGSVISCGFEGWIGSVVPTCGVVAQFRVQSPCQTVSRTQECR